MQIIDPTAALALLGGVVLAALAAVVMAALALPATLRVTRRDRHARRESIPAYYGQLHFVN